MGGTLCCRHHIQRLSSDPHIDLTVLAMGPDGWRAETEAFLVGLDIPHHFEPWAEFAPFHRENSLKGIASFALSLVFQYPWELPATQNKPRIDQILDQMITEHAVDALIIDYPPTAQFMTLPRTDVQTFLVWHNRQGDIYKSWLQQGRSHHGKFTGPISLQRYRAFEKRASRAVDQVIVISPADVPDYGLKRPPVCVTPAFNPMSEAWRYGATRRAFFVGNIAHNIGNLAAVRWICEKLAPSLLEIGSDVRISIVGAEAHQLAQPSPSNVDFMGVANEEVVDSLFRTADLMLCPIDNDHGVKIKIMEAITYGTPVLASAPPLKAFAHLPELPVMDLDQPVSAARLLTELVNNRAGLQALHAYEVSTHADFIASQRHSWSRAIGAVLGAGAG
jgi:glycosyltransferase involved in cell wall biosynthesis